MALVDGDYLFRWVDVLQNGVIIRLSISMEPPVANMFSILQLNGFIHFLRYRTKIWHFFS